MMTFDPLNAIRQAFERKLYSNYCTLRGYTVSLACSKFLDYVCLTVMMH